MCIILSLLIVLSILPYFRIFLPVTFQQKCLEIKFVLLQTGCMKSLSPSSDLSAKSLDFIALVT